MSEEKAIIQRIAHDLIGDLPIEERREVVAHLVDEYGAGKGRGARRVVEMEHQHKGEIARLRARVAELEWEWDRLAEHCDLYDSLCETVDSELPRYTNDDGDDCDEIDRVCAAGSELRELQRERDEARDQIRQWQETSAAEVASIIALREECGAGARETFPDFVRRLAYERDAATKRAEEAEALLREWRQTPYYESRRQWSEWVQAFRPRVDAHLAQAGGTDEPD